MSLREEWTHEDHLIHHRLAWLFYAQALLLGAYALSLDHTDVKDFRDAKSAVLIHILPWVGLVSVSITFAGLLAAMMTQRAIEGKAKADGSVRTWTRWSTLGYLPPVGLPLLLAFVWLMIILAR